MLSWRNFLYNYPLYYIACSLYISKKLCYLPFFFSITPQTTLNILGNEEKSVHESNWWKQLNKGKLYIVINNYLNEMFHWSYHGISD